MRNNYFKSFLFTSLLFFLGSLVINGQTVYTFTNCSATGNTGPTQTQVNNAYSSTNLNGQVTATNGIQYWQVPATGKYLIEVTGAKGGGPNGGKGAEMIGEFLLTGGTTLKIIVGQQGEYYNNSTRIEYSGGGGSYVATSTNTPLIVAGGGGGANISNVAGDGSTGTAGNNGGGGHSNANGGTGGAGGSYNNQTSDGGAGFTGNGGSGNPNPAPQSFINGGQGGCNSWSSSTLCAQGGFGGGGGTNRNSTTWWACGGGGGYSGGGAAYGQLSNLPYAGGGGSYNNGTNQINTGGVGTGDGLVVIKYFPSKPNDAAVSSLVSPGNECVGTYPVQAQIYNAGTNQITTVDVMWTIDGVPQTTYTHSNVLDTANGVGSSSAIVTLGTVSMIGGITKTIKVWTDMPNGTKDPVIANDQVTKQVLGYAYPTVNIGADQFICPEDSATFNSGTGYDSLLWSNSATTPSITVNAQGKYLISVFKNGCETKDSALVTHYPGAPAFSLGNDTTLCFGDSLVLDATITGMTYEWQDNSTNPTFTVTKNGLYKVTIEDANGCNNDDAINITYYLEPGVTIYVAPSKNICYGVPQTFTAFPLTQGSIDYQWKINGVNQGPQTTSPTFNGPADDGDSVSVDLITDICALDPYPVPSNKIGMTVNPKPRNINGKLLVKENVTETYVVPLSTGSAYVWRVKGGTISGDSTKNIVTIKWGAADPNGKLILVEKDTKNCERENEVDVNIVSIVGVDNITSGFGIGDPYPNPSNNLVTIPIHANKDWDITVQLFDVSGKLVKTIYHGRISGDKNLQMSVDDLQNGLYFYKLTTADGYMAVKRLTVEH